MARTSWQQYQALAAHLLDRFAKDFGLEKVEVGQSVPGSRSRTTWALDAKGTVIDGTGFVIVEARQYRTKRQVQEQLAALAYRILDTGASGAIVVSPLGFQDGAALVAAAENVISVELSPDSTSDEFAMKFLNRLYVGLAERATAQDTVSSSLERTCLVCGVRFMVQANEAECEQCANAA
jgi:hypothetical protein